MMYKIISDSSSDLCAAEQNGCACAPLRIITNASEYVDDESLEVEKMVDELRQYKGTSQTSCPNAEDWETAFGEEEGIFCVTISSGVSGSYNAAHAAMQAYLQKHPERQGYVLDSFSAGAGHAMLIEKLQELTAEKMSFDEIVRQMEAYRRKTHLVFSLESLFNLANNGRVSMAVAKLAGLLGIRIIGRAGAAGTLDVIGKARGAKKALEELVKYMLKNEYSGGKVRIHHCQNPEGAESLAAMLRQRFPQADVVIRKTRGLCSFYAEAGGLLVGFEGVEKGL